MSEIEPTPHQSNTNLANYEMALRSAIENGYLTEDDADMAMQAFIHYEFGDIIEEYKRVGMDEQMKEQGIQIDNLAHAISEGWLSNEDALRAIRDFHGNIE